MATTTHFLINVWECFKSIPDEIVPHIIINLKHLVVYSSSRFNSFHIGNEVFVCLMILTVCKNYQN